MGLTSTVKYIGHKIRDTAVDAVNDVKFAGKQFRSAPHEEKTWIILKTIVIAALCGITLGLVAGPVVGVITGVVGAAYALLRFSKNASQHKNDVLNDAVRGVKNVARDAKGGVQKFVGDLADGAGKLMEGAEDLLGGHNKDHHGEPQHNPAKH